MIKNYKKRMPKIQAIKFEDTAKNIEEINNFLSNSGIEEIKVDYSDKNKPVLKFKIDKNTIRVPKGDYIAKNKDYIFSLSYSILLSNISSSFTLNSNSFDINVNCSVSISLK